VSEFTADTKIEAALERDPRVVDLFGQLGLKCAARRDWCVAVEKETLRHAALYHGVDLGRLLDALNRLKLPPKP
jgi:hypothetical protein